ncbi:Sas10 C-terminal domain-containing protein [Cynara cardunculus var. scolymus]|uniref:Sas10 C-terminal domain-containing protein n=1 Tax=Cynara cardunculus var. scolymus TaxID=59895 RepID=A0A103YG35_CYNCS|nr:Sas10 C-terminal domain-containing protein [Cynara cardunculus var. scolymus]
MAKGSKAPKSNRKTPQKRLSNFSDSDMDDEIDAFHKQRDIVPLDLDDDIGESDEDNEQHVFQIEQHKSLKAKIGGAKDETQDDAEDEENKSVAWGRNKGIYYDNDKGESSEDEEEAEVLRLQNEKTRLYSNADHGLEDDEEDESEGEPTFEENLRKGKVTSKASVDHGAQDEIDTGYEVVMKDPNSLSKEEQMDIVYNSAPELVGLLSELNEAVEQLETKVDPILSKLKEEKNLNKTGIQYMELKKQLLLSYCQAITFHLLLKSEGHPVRDHPVLARLVEIKNLLDKMKPLDENLSFEVEDFLKKQATTTVLNSPEEMAAIDPSSLINNSETKVVSSETQKEPHVETKFVKKKNMLDGDNGGKRKRQNEQMGLQSVEMLKVRAALEEKLKQKGVFDLKAPKTSGVKKNLKPLNGKLEALDDFDDDAFDIDENQNKSSNAIPPSRLSRLVTQIKKPRVISGDDDLPKRDDIGERRRKHEMRVLASAGVQSDDDLQDDEPGTLEDDEVNDTNEDGGTDSESDLYKEIKIKRDAKLAAKAQKYSRTAPSVVAAPETLSDGKRHINYEMEKNRGLTRKRNKDLKNPRKKYKLKHKKKEVARKGQVREHRKPAGPYGGEGSGINTISRSIRFKS